jgi:hypothetical protein
MLCSVLNDAFSAGHGDLFAYFGVCVRAAGVRNFQPQPDVVVVPGVSGYDLYSERFQLVGEVLSPSNTRAEIALKLRRYREAPNNLYAVVIEPREFLVEIYAKSRNWELIRNPADPFYSVIPGRAEGAGPESITPVLREETLRSSCNFCGYGFRARRFAAPRNDELIIRIRYDDPYAARRSDRNARVRPALPARRSLPWYAARSAANVARFRTVRFKDMDGRNKSGHDAKRHFIASGLVGEPTAPVIGMAGATNMNS